eukprot:4682177-Alexandrium_andersonii.AAC.2
MPQEGHWLGAGGAPPPGAGEGHRRQRRTSRYVTGAAEAAWCGEPAVPARRGQSEHEAQARPSGLRGTA